MARSCQGEASATLAEDRRLRHPSIGRPIPWIAMLLVIFIALACEKKYPSPEGMDAEHGFQGVVLPVLYDQCEGCHFAGGVMYRDLPFDDRELVLTRGDELLLQLRGNGKERVAQWLALARQDTSSVKTGGGTPLKP